MYTGNIEERVINLQNEQEVIHLRSFLASFALTFDNKVEYTVALFRGERMIATGSLAGEVLRNLAVDMSFQGEGLTALLVSHLIQEAARRGRFHYFMYTKPEAAHLFMGLGFREIVRVEPYVVLLESGLGSIESYCKEIQKATCHLKGDRAAVVVNGNPFTKGHLALIDQAAQESDAVIVFVVSEDQSVFPFSHRFKLVQESVATMPNVVVVPTGKYQVSAATFPTYFTRDEVAVAAQTKLDITLFAACIAAKLGIKSRYIGQEPYCKVTSAYNSAMFEILPQYGITVKIIERIQVDGEMISASAVRNKIQSKDWSAIKNLVPAPTWNFLVSENAKEIVKKIQNSNGYHK